MRGLGRPGGVGCNQSRQAVRGVPRRRLAAVAVDRARDAAPLFQKKLRRGLLARLAGRPVLVRQDLGDISGANGDAVLGRRAGRAPPPVGAEAHPRHRRPRSKRFIFTTTALEHELDHAPRGHLFQGPERVLEAGLELQILEHRLRVPSLGHVLDAEQHVADARRAQLRRVAARRDLGHHNTGLVFFHN